MTQGIENTSTASSSASAQRDTSSKLQSQHEPDIGGEGSVARARTSSGSQPQFGGTFEKLTLAQRKLVDVWFARYKERTGRSLDPANAYGLVSVSIRTTFEGITNALAHTSLTDKGGSHLGTAVDLVESVDTVNDKILRARGDSQFRMYVVMKPDAVKILASCREFSRKKDNSIFHNGYPLNYRQGGGDPSIQVSMSRDGMRADIDVDYRSSRFPAGLFNGHLTAANSDIRAGNNYRGHLRRWNGLANWWRDLFGLPVEGDSGFVPEPEREIPSRPRLTASSNLADIVDDYLSLWLVQRKPNLAVAYISSRAFACVNAEAKRAGRPTNTNTVPHKLWNDLEETNFLLGRPASLTDVIEPVDLMDPAYLPVTNVPKLPFNLVQVPDGIAEELDCSGASEPALPSPKFGMYFGSAFRIKAPEGRGAVLLLIWQKENSFWKIVNIQIDSVNAKNDPVPDETAAEITPSPEQGSGEPAMIHRMQDFFDALFVKKDSAKAFLFFAPSACACAGLSLDNAGRKGAGGELREGLKVIARRALAANDLGRIIERDDPENATLKILEHADDQAYLLAIIPDSEIPDLLCGRALRPDSTVGNNASSSGSYFGTFFKLVEPGDEPAALRLLWSKQNGEWRIVGYKMDQP